jgi:protein SCO1/2
MKLTGIILLVRRSTRAAAAVSLFAATLLLASSAIPQARPSATQVFNDVGIEQRLGETLPLGLTFTDENGRTVELGEYFTDKPVVLSLVYYKCRMLCPQVLSGMTESFRTLELTVGKEFRVVSVSIDHRETPADAHESQTKYIRDYARDRNVPAAEGGTDDRERYAAGWHFLTGDSAQIARLARAVGFTYLYDEKTGQYAHASGLMIATPGGKLSRYLYGIEYGAKDLTFSLMEASHESIGTPVDKLLLLCFHYDPMTGKYGLVVANLLRAGGALVVLVLGGYMLAGYRRDRRRRAAALADGGS